MGLISIWVFSFFPRDLRPDWIFGRFFLWGISPSIKSTYPGFFRDGIRWVSKSEIFNFCLARKAVTLKTMMSRTEPGMTTAELDLIGKQLLDNYGAKSAPMVTYNFPGYTCISINEEAAHGIPGERVIQPGDVVNIDVSAEKNGFFADTGGSFVVPPSSALKDRLLHATKLALDEACIYASAGKPINGIGKSIQYVAKQKGFKIIKNLCGHGVGKSLHEDPKEIHGFYLPSGNFSKSLIYSAAPVIPDNASLILLLVDT